MVLPGKLTIGLLHEDNPMKSFFRMKPILTEEGTGFVSSDIDEKFPEEGFIRIVPDRNEIATFKMRMRQMGRYCALDLRKHLSENDKIRPNKNYIPGGPERNANIVYSDVIGRLPLELIAEVVDTEEPLDSDSIRQNMELPGTAYVILQNGDKLSGPWSWEAMMDEPGMVQMTPAEDQPFSQQSASLLAGASMLVPIDDETDALLLYDLSAFELESVTLPEVERMGFERTPAESMPHSTSQLMGRDPIYSEGYRSLDATFGGQMSSKQEEFPWLTKSDPLRQRTVDARTSVREPMLPSAARRGRSLYQVVDEQWRKARNDQLGSSLLTSIAGRPIANPVERAVLNVNEAWAQNEARTTLLDELLKNDDLKEALKGELSIPEEEVSSRDLNRKLNELEAARLKVITEIDALKLKRDEAKASLLGELRRANQEELSEYEHRNHALKAEIDRNERVAQTALSSAHAKQQLLEETDTQLKDKILQSIVNQQLTGLFADTEASGPVSHPETYEPTAGELISDVRIKMERAGYSLTNDEAVNLLACLMAGGTLIVSGPSGSGKSELLRNLADVLGIGYGSDRFVEAQSPDDARVKALLKQDDHITKLLLLLDDFNTGCMDKRLLEIYRLQEDLATNGIPMNLLLTAQDAPDGAPIPARLLARSFLIRLKATPSGAEWKPLEIINPDAQRAVSLSALRRIFPVDGELPGEMVERFNKLREGLAKLNYIIDRRTLNELWYYCSAVRPLMLGTHLELLDLALSQRAIPQMLASMDIQSLHELPKLLLDLPRSLNLLDQALPLPPL